MAYPISQPIKIWIRWGEIRGRKAIEAAIHAAIGRALEVAVFATIDLMRKIVPESILRRPPYSTKQQARSEKLMITAITKIFESLLSQQLGGFKKRYGIKFGYYASYARFINLKRNVRKWSKKGSKTGFYGETKQELIQSMREALAFELDLQPRLKQYIGAKRYG